MQYRILAIDNDTLILESLEKVLKLEGYQIDCLSNPLKVADKIKTNSYHCILLDIKMPGMNGLEVLNIILKESQTTPVIMISGQSNIDIAVKSIKEGAYDFIEKPIIPERLLITIEHAIQKRQLMHQNETISHELEKSYRMIGVSPAIVKIHKDIRIIAPTTAKVMISGDTGTGKELVAKAIHYQSERSDKPYLKINCAAIPPDLLESQLFGHKRGAFSGAVQDHDGFFIHANGGTLFLDEIGDMNLTLQSKLLRVLQESEVDLIGDPHPVKIDVRIISATNKNLLELIQKGLFREDLYHRLKVVEISIPPLNQRPDDILPLAYHFLNQFRDEYNRRVLKIHQQAEAYLLNYSWPGNVRELKNIVEKLVLFSTGDILSISDVMEAFQNGVKPAAVLAMNESNDHLIDLKTAVQNFEKQFIIQTLNKNSWRVDASANSLGIDRSSLFRKRAKFNISNTPGV